MKFKPSAQKKGNLVVELEPGNSRLLDSLTGPITDLKEVLVPTDFSECSKHALRYALAFARQFDARITLLSVMSDSPTGFDFANAEYLANLDDRRKKYADELTKLAKKELGGFRYETVVRAGRPDEEIVKAAFELDSDLIVISTHGSMGMVRAEIGSTAERVVRRARCPVLVVRQREREFAPPA